MSDKQTMRRPQNIFEAINQNIVDLSQDIVKLYALVEEIHSALYPPVQDNSEPDADGADTINE